MNETHHNSIKEANARMYTKAIYKLNVIDIPRSMSVYNE